MLSTKSKDIIALLQRSPDIGAGWRKVSTTVWPLIEDFNEPELLELDVENLHVRLSPRGEAVVQYL